MAAYIIYAYISVRTLLTSQGNLAVVELVYYYLKRRSCYDFCVEDELTEETKSRL